MDFTDETIRLVASIQKPKQPQGNDVTETDFNVSTRYKSIISVLHLTFSFLASTDFKQIFLLQQKIAPARDVDIHAQVLHLTGKKVSRIVPA